MLMIIILSGTVLYSQQSGSLAALGNLGELVGVSWKNPLRAQTKPTQNPLRGKPVEEKVDESYVQSLLLEEPKLPTSDAGLDRRADARTESAITAHITEVKPVGESLGIPLNQTRTVKTRRQSETFFYYNNEAAMAAEKLEFEIYKAIHNRAIRGVEVSVRDGTVYLTGQVATENQKLAVAQAARSVPGVNEVRDHTSVNAFYHSGNSR
jgi:hypothetical protein